MRYKGKIKKYPNAERLFIFRESAFRKIINYTIEESFKMIGVVKE